MRHSLAHLLAAAVLKRFPGTKLGIGPTIENGFYYDFLVSRSNNPRMKSNESRITEQDLPAIEKDMRGLIRQSLSFAGKKVTPAQAKKMFASQPFKLDLIKEFVKGKKQLTAYITGSAPKKLVANSLVASGYFVDLCRGGHVSNTKEIDPDAFKLTKLAGAYWRGNEKNPMLTRVYGVAFSSKKELEDYLKMMEEVEKRDHKKLGPRLELFMFHETAPGMPYWLPKGVKLYNALVNFWREEHNKRNYHEIVSPIINKKDLYITSGHFDHYWSDMFVAKTPEGEEYGVKAMNCPNAMVVFGYKTRSYKDLPLRFSDTDPLHRNELSGTLNGLLRVREFRQDDAHCFVTEDMIGDEYKNIFEIVERFYSIFNLSYRFRLGTRPKSFMGDIKTWNKAEVTLKKILQESGKEYSIEEGDGAFYGPKVDIIMKDAMGREWQMGTIQLDFQQPRRFNLAYTDRDGKDKTPIAIHRVIYGSMERFIGILIEHFAGALPLWLAPVQAQILPVSEKTEKYGKEILEKLRAENIRAELTDSNETLSKRIREAEMQKIPYILVVGEKETTNKTVSIRHYRRGQEGEVKIESFIEKLRSETRNKTI